MLAFAKLPMLTKGEKTMPKKNLIAIIAMVVSLIVASLTLVFTVGLRVSADEETIVQVDPEHLNIENDVL